MHRVGLLVVMLIGGVALLGRPPVAVGQDDRAELQSVGMLNVEGVSAPVMREVRAAINGPDGAGKDGPLAAVGMELALLYHQHRIAGAKGVRALREATAPRPKTEADQGRQGVHSRVRSPISANEQFVFVEAIAIENASRLLRELRQLGLEEGAVVGPVVSGRLPISAIKQAAALPSLRGMVPSYARTSVGSVESEADSAHAADTARLNTGTSGNGQKVCVLSDSYNTASVATSASEDVQSGDLPGNGNPAGRTTPVDVLEDYDGTDPSPTDEGRAMLQLIHDIAPGATLGFHTAFGGLGVFTTGIEDLADAGCTVIVDDVRYNVEPFYQDGPVSNAVDDVVNNDEVSYFSSAGNDGRNSYEAPFRDSGNPGVISSSSVAHDFDSSTLSTDTRQKITIEADGTFQIFSFQWTDPSALVEGSSGPDTDIDIALVTENDSIVARSSDDNISIGFPVESFEYTNDGSSAETRFLVIEKAAGPAPDQIKSVYSGSDFTIEEYDTAGPTIYGHPMAEGAMAVAAAPFYNTAAFNPNADPAALEPFSSKGGIKIRFDQNGNALGTPEDRKKPEVTGTDAVDNTFFGDDIRDSFFNGIDADPHPNFFGTSAAAPNIAAIAALIKQARPELAPSEVYTRLEENSEDVTTRQTRSGDFVSIASGRDPWSGYGFVWADEAVPPVSIAITNADAASQETSGSEEAVKLTWRLIGSGDEADVSEFVIKHRYFGGDFTVRARVEANGAGEYSETIEDLPVGTHQFRIKGVGAAEDSLLVESLVSTTVRASGVNVTAYPNPFSGPVNLSVTLPEVQDDEQSVTIRVFDILGRHVATPIRDGTIQASGSKSFTLGPVRSLASGVYFFRVRGEDFVETTKAVRTR